MTPHPSDHARVGVLVFGPQETADAVYGGGRGGVVTAMEAMGDFLDRRGVQHSYCGYSVRTRSRIWHLMLPARLCVDMFRLACRLAPWVSIVHVVANGPYGVYRTLAASLVSRAAFRKVFVDVRGNNLDAYSREEGSWAQRRAWRVVLALAEAVLVQPRSTCAALRRSFGDKIVHHPNWIRAPLNPPCRNILSDEMIRVIFVGFCYEAKGIRDLVTGCALACEHGMRIELSLIGHEDQKYASWLDRVGPQQGLIIRRLGRQPRDQVLSQLARSDIFVFPSYHPGEGHPNAVNEAAASGLAIVTTPVGSVIEFLDSESAYFVAARSASDISALLQHIGCHRSEARAKAQRAQETVLRDFSEDRVLGGLLNAYGRTVKVREDARPAHRC